MASDMVGYSRLMELDEIGVLERQKSHRREIVDPAIKKHRGKTVKTTGDGMLILFDVEIQTAMAEREASVVSDNRIRYRVGINIGDIIL